MSDVELTLIAGMAILTFLPRYLPFAFAGKVDLPAWLERAFQYIPIAVLSTIVVQMALIRDGVMRLDWDNAHLISAAVTAMAAMLLRRQLLVISIGLVAYLLAY